MAAKWTGPGVIVELKNYSALVKFPNAKAKLYNLHQLKPYFDSAKNLPNQGVGPGASSEDTIELIKNQ